MQVHLARRYNLSPIGTIAQCVGRGSYFSGDHSHDFAVNGSWVYDLTLLRECITNLGLDGRNERLRTGQHLGAENVGRGL